jgi:hypothetical protein
VLAIARAIGPWTSILIGFLAAGWVVLIMALLAGQPASEHRVLDQVNAQSTEIVRLKMTPTPMPTATPFRFATPVH